MGHIPAGTLSKRGINNSASVVVGKKQNAQDEETTRNEFKSQTITGPLSPQCTETPFCTILVPQCTCTRHVRSWDCCFFRCHVHAHTLQSTTPIEKKIFRSVSTRQSRRVGDTFFLFFILQWYFFFFVLTNLPAPPLMLMNLNKELNQICGRNTRNCLKNERRLHTICDDETQENTLPSLPLL